MKLQYTTKNGRMTVELEADTQSELWQQLANFQEVFEHEVTYNGKTSDEIKFIVREVDDNQYYELHYGGNDKDLLFVKKAFGQHKKGGGLFPKRKDADGNYIGKFENNGWVKYNKETGKEE